MASSFIIITRHGAAIEVSSVSYRDALCADEKHFSCGSAEASTGACEKKPQP